MEDDGPHLQAGEVLLAFEKNQKIYGNAYQTRAPMEQILKIFGYRMSFLQAWPTPTILYF